LTFKVAPAATETDEVREMDPGTISVPEEITVPAEYVLAPESVRLPVPVLTREMESAPSRIEPEKMLV